MADENTPAPLSSEVGPEVERVVATPPVVEEVAPAEEEALPEGFDSWEAFGKAQAKAAKAAPANEETPEEKPAAEEITPEVQAELDKLPEATREKAAPFFQEFAANGELSPESKKAAAEAFGVTEEMVDLYIEGAKSEQGKAVAPLYEAAGGKDQYDAFASWANAGGLTPAEQAEFNERLDKGPEEAAKVISEAVALWREQGNGAPPKDITRNQPAKGSAAEMDVYASRAEMQADMNNPKYAKDPAFRAKVEAKVGRSTAF